jgi:hypothetical protein
MQLCIRLTKVASHLSRQEDRAVIGALEGTEEEIATIRTFMLLARDCFPLQRREGGSH